MVSLNIILLEVIPKTALEFKTRCFFGWQRGEMKEYLLYFNISMMKIAEKTAVLKPN
jgi:hypothetical protein